jgi:hypothetical protein
VASMQLPVHSGVVFVIVNVEGITRFSAVARSHPCAHRLNFSQPFRVSHNRMSTPWEGSALANDSRCADGDDSTAVPSACSSSCSFSSSTSVRWHGRTYARPQRIDGGDRHGPHASDAHVKVVAAIDHDSGRTPV